MTLDLVLLGLAAGFIYLLMGGDLLVRGAVGLARRLDVPPVVVAATVVGFGTSLPELVVSVQATVDGYPDLILGNVVGSNIANVLLVGGASALVHPLLHDDEEVHRNVALMGVSVVAFALFAATGPIGRIQGAILFGGFVVMMAASARSTVRARRDADPSIPLDWVLGIPSRLGLIAVFIVLGIVWLPLGASLLVDSAVAIAVELEIPETVVGLTILAVGTSLPELTTTILAAMEERSDVAIGAIVGSNTFNVLAIMGITASISPEAITVSSRMLLLDIPFMLATGAVLAFLVWRVLPIGRGIGVAMLVTYAAYLASLYFMV